MSYYSPNVTKTGYMYPEQGSFNLDILWLTTSYNLVIDPYW